MGALIKTIGISATFISQLQELRMAHILVRDDSLLQEISITSYGCVVILTAFLWDWVLSIPSEARAAHRTGFHAPIIAYYISRVSSGAYCVCVFLTGLFLVPGNKTVETAKFAFSWTAVAATSLLFVLRVRAVYSDNKIVRAFFSVLWLLVVTSQTAILYDYHIPCQISKSDPCDPWDPLSAVPSGLLFINDTLVFILISWKICRNSIFDRGQNYRAKVRLILQGQGLYNVSKLLLRSGQLYYGVTIGAQVASAVMVVFGFPYSDLVGLFSVALSCAMSCRVFRMVLLCNEPDHALATQEIEETFRAASLEAQRVGKITETDKL